MQKNNYSFSESVGLVVGAFLSMGWAYMCMADTQEHGHVVTCVYGFGFIHDIYSYARVQQAQTA